MHYRNIGFSDMRISALAFGAWQLGDVDYWGASGAAENERVVAAAIDAGINFFDTAEMYGNGEAERALGAALRGRRDKVYVASKVMPEHCEPAKLRAACEASLDRLAMDHLDLYQIHWPFRHVPFAEAYGELAQLKEEGKIRAIGVSNFGPKDLAEWHSEGECVSNQIGYNLLFRAPEFEILPACRRLGVGVLAYMPLMQGLLSGRYESVDEIPEKRRRTRHFASTRPGTRHSEPGCENAVMKALEDLRSLSDEAGETMATLSIAWLLAQPGVTAVLVGGRKVEQLQGNLRAVEISLDADLVQRLNDITEPIKQHLRSNADMWDSGDAARIR